MAFLLIIIFPNAFIHICPFVMDLVLVCFGIYIQEFPEDLIQSFFRNKATNCLEITFFTLLNRLLSWLGNQLNKNSPHIEL